MGQLYYFSLDAIPPLTFLKLVLALSIEVESNIHFVFFTWDEFYERVDRVTTACNHWSVTDLFLHNINFILLPCFARDMPDK
jgi:hypothetical protein